MSSSKLWALFFSGAMMFSPQLAFAVCGDGERDMGETCDDGDVVSGDGCSDMCMVEPGYTCTEQSFMLTGTEQTAGSPVGNWSTPAPGTYETVQSANNAASVYNTNVFADVGEIVFNMRVDPGSGDDDLMGWTVGLEAGELDTMGMDGDRDYLLFNWKRGTQGTRTPGLWYNRVDGPATGGNVVNTDLWSSTGNVTKISQADESNPTMRDLGVTGWQESRWYQVRMRYSASRFLVWVTPAAATGDNPVFAFDATNDLAFDETGTFPVGVDKASLGFYSHSQAGTRFELISANGPLQSDNCVTNEDGDDVRDLDDADSDGDGIADLVEMPGFTNDPDRDTDLDGVPDWQDPDDVPGGCTVVGMSNVCTTLPDALDRDGDGVPNHLDRESDGDNLTDAFEAGLVDANSDGVPDACVATDASGLCVAGGLTGAAPDADGDMIPNFLDADDDNDGVLTLAEDVNNNGNPADDIGANGPVYLDPCDPNPDALACPTGDTDGDGVDNQTENAAPTSNPLDPCDPNPDALACDTGDADGDGLANGLEAMLGTMPDNADSDGDGLCDGLTGVATVCVAGENAAGGQNSDTDMLIDALDDDDDNDLIPTRDEDLDGDGDYTEHDTDGDGTPNWLDSNDNDGPLGDLDGDGILNGVEATLGTLANNADSDGDGLCDGVSAVAGVCFAGEDAAGGQNSDGDMLIDALDDDDDNDGVSTAAEDTDANGNPADDIGANGPRYLDPCDPDSDAVACDTGDADDDGEPNGTDPDPLDPCNPDPNDLACGTGDADGDGLTNAQEVLLGTLPGNADSDSDGLCDGLTAVAGVCFAGENAAGGQNSDTDMLIDALDDDDDNDLIPTRDEDLDGDGDYTEHDTDGDGTPNWLDSNDNDGPTGDLDGDGITNADEATLGTLPGNADSDGDGLCDGVSAVAGVCFAGEDAAGGQNSDTDMLIDALDADDDDDGVLTSAEDTDANGNPADDIGANGPRYLDPCDPDADALACDTGDTDGDGEPNGTDPDPQDPCNPDPNDPLCDSGDADSDGISNSVETTLGTLVNSADSDGDGLCDGVIAVAGVCVAGEDAVGGQNFDMDMLIDALDVDDDGDGVPTLDEDLDGDNDPTNDDTDGDTVPNYLDTDDDGDDVDTLDEDLNANGDPTDDIGADGPRYLDACDPDADALACDTGDTDGDGEPNGTDPDPLDPCNPDPNDALCDSGDTDGDGITNGVEVTLGTLVDSADSDGDGLCDGVIAVAGVCVAGEDAVGGQNSDSDALIDALDADDDGDGVDTADEDVDGDGDPLNDNTDGDALPNYLDDDDDDDGILTINEDVNGNGDPTDDNSDEILGNDVPNYLDADDDGDGVNTVDESADPNGDGDPADAVDTSMNGFADYLDPCTPDDQGQACLDGDTDGDGFSNDPNDDPEPLNPCVPNPDALTCPTGDPDMDGISNEDEATYMTNPESNDSDGDGVLDDVEIGTGDMPLDTDDDGIIDALDTDDDGDGVPTLSEDLDEDGDPTNDDTDDDAVPNYLDADDDGDGIPTLSEDLDGDGDPTNDNTDGDEGLPNYLDADDDNDGVLTRFELGDNAPAELQDTDNDNIPDYLDTDDDQDGVPTIDEGADPNGDGDPADAMDIDGNDIPDYLDNGVPAEDAVEITSPAADSTVAPDFQVSGTATPGAEVEVSVDGVVVDTVTADDEGDWSIDLTDQPAGERTIDVKVGDETDSVTVTVDEDMMPEAVEITSPSADATVAPGFQVSGTATPGAEVEVSVDGVVVDTVTADDEGNWSIDLTDQPAGERTIDVKVGQTTDSVTVTVDDTLQPLEAAVTSPTNGEDVPAGDVVVSGTATPGAEIDVLVDGAVVGTVTADDEGNWSFTVTDLDEGEHTVSADAKRDGEGVSSEPVTFNLLASNDDEFADLALTGGCNQVPGEEQAPTGFAAFLALMGFGWLRRRNKKS